jgi:hypothetical protein
VAVLGDFVKDDTFDMIFTTEMLTDFPEYLFNSTELKVICALPDNFHL